MSEGITWLIEPLLFENHAEEFKKTKARFVKTSLDLSDPLPKISGKVIAHGSLQLAKKIRIEKPEWNPGAIVDISSFEWNTYAPKLKGLLLNDEWETTTTTELVQLAKNGELKECFVRPNAGDKPFGGTVISGDPVLWLAQCEMFVRYGGNIPAIVSRLQSIESEWRLIVLNDRVVTGCQYMQGDCLKLEAKDLPSESVELANRAISRKPISDVAYVIDVAELKDRTWKVIEFNGFSSADWYSCPLNVIVDAFEKYFSVV